MNIKAQQHKSPKICFWIQIVFFFFAVCAMHLVFHAHKYGAAVKASEYVEKEASANRLWSLEGISYSTAVVSRQVTPHRWNKKLFPTTATLEGPAFLERKCTPWEGSGDTFDPDLSSPMDLSASYCLPALHMYQHIYFDLLPFAVLHHAQKANFSGTDLSYLSTKSYAY